MKRQHGADATFLAGGTDVIVRMNHGLQAAKVFIDLTHVPNTNDVRLEERKDGNFYIAQGGATFAQLGKLPVRCLAEASLSVGGPQIRNRGTIAGNLASASPAGDGSVALLALNAEVEMRSLVSARSLPLRDFFLDYRKTALQPDEIITSVTFPADWKTGWHKLGKRGAMNISLVCCAVGMSPKGEFHAAFGSAGPYPLYTPKTAEFLTASSKGGKPLTGAAMDEAARIASEEVRPIDDFRGSGEYRRAMAGSLLKKALRQIFPA